MSHKGPALVVLIIIVKHTSAKKRSGNFKEQDLLLIAPKGYTAFPRATVRLWVEREGGSEDPELCHIRIQGWDTYRFTGSLFIGKFKA